MHTIIAAATVAGAAATVAPARWWWVVRRSRAEALRLVAGAVAMIAVMIPMATPVPAIAALAAAVVCFPAMLLSATGRALPPMRAHRGVAYVAMAAMLVVMAGGGVTGGADATGHAHGSGAGDAGVLPAVAIALVGATIVLGVAAVAAHRRVHGVQDPPLLARAAAAECLAMTVAALACLTHLLPS